MRNVRKEVEEVVKGGPGSGRRKGYRKLTPLSPQHTEFLGTLRQEGLHWLADAAHSNWKNGKAYRVPSDAKQVLTSHQASWIHPRLRRLNSGYK